MFQRHSRRCWGRRLAFWAALYATGQAGSVMAGGPPHGGLEAHFRQFDGTGITKPLREFVAGDASLLVWQRFSLRKWDVRADFTRISSLTRLRYVDGVAEVGFEPASPMTSLQLQITPPLRVATLALGVQIPDGAMRKPGVLLGFWLQPIHVLGLGLEATAPPEWPTQWTAAMDGEGGTLGWNAHTVRTHWRTEFTPTGTWRVSGHLQEDRIIPGDDIGDASSEFSLRPAGLLLMRSLEVGKQVQPGGLEVGLRLSNADFTGRIHGYTEGARFGQLGVLEVTWMSWQATAQGRFLGWAWSGLVAHGDAEFVSSGVLKFWPFTDGLADLLGARRHLEMSGQASWWQLGSHSSRNISSRFEFSAGVDLYRIRPEISMLSWQPLLFGMGISDPRTSQLNVTRVDLGALQFRLGWHLSSSITAQAAVKQWIPLGLENSHRAVHDSEPASAAVTGVGKGDSDGFRFGTGLALSAGLSLAW